MMGPHDLRIPPYARDLRAWVKQPKRQRDQDQIRRHVLHRAGGPGWPEDTLELCRALMPHWPGTGSPYWAFIELDGTVVVVADLEDIGAHAAAWNTPGLGTAVWGDFRARGAPPTDAQVRATIRHCEWVARECGLTAAQTVEHGELPGATNHPDKICPGPLFPIERIRSELEERLKKERVDANR